MHPNQQTIEKFHSASARLVVGSKAQCYLSDAAFDDAFSPRGHARATGLQKYLANRPRNGG
ncbi:MAG: hypothetical protein H7238_04460 [Polaromonas sp.]|nr:hypothetical protein [Polaromonas sp.]